MNKTLSGELKNKGKSSWSIPKVVAVACESNSLQSLSHSSNQGFHEGGRNYSWSLTRGFARTALIVLHYMFCFQLGEGRVE